MFVNLFIMNLPNSKKFKVKILKNDTSKMCRYKIINKKYNQLKKEMKYLTENSNFSILFYWYKVY